LIARPKVEDKLEPQRTTDVQFIEESDKPDKVVYSRLAKPKALEG
jgi:hypothetical protein